MTRPAVLVTGGATRIGAEIVRGFATAGWHTVIHYNSSADPAEALAAELPSAQVVQCDVSDPDAAEAMIESLAKEVPNWRCLINSASVFRTDDVTRLDVATNLEAMRVNAISPALMAQAFLKNAVSDGVRSVIQVTDMKLENPNPDFFSYTMSKHALAATIPMLSQGAADVKDRVYGIAPGAILASHDQSEEETEISHRLNLLERKTDAQEIVQTALFLAKGALKSGSTVFVDSGQHLLSQDRDVIYLAREATSEAPGA